VADDPLSVSYPLADVLREIDRKLGKIVEELGGKADRAELEALREKHDANGARITTLERIEENRDKGAENRRANVALWISGVAALAAVLAVVVTMIAGIR
jgi:hypothetical protein